MRKRLQWLWNRWRWRKIASWRVIYDDGSVSIPLYREDAETRAKFYDGNRVVWARDHRGDLLPRETFLPEVPRANV